MIKRIMRRLGWASVSEVQALEAQVIEERRRGDDFHSLFRAEEEWTQRLALRVRDAQGQAESLQNALHVRGRTIDYLAHEGNVLAAEVRALGEELERSNREWQDAAESLVVYHVWVFELLGAQPLKAIGGIA